MSEALERAERLVNDLTDDGGFCPVCNRWLHVITSCGAAECPAGDCPDAVAERQAKVEKAAAALTAAERAGYELAYARYAEDHRELVAVMHRDRAAAEREATERERERCARIAHGYAYTGPDGDHHDDEWNKCAKELEAQIRALAPETKP